MRCTCCWLRPPRISSSTGFAYQHTLPARVPDRVSLRLSFGTFLELSTRRLPQVRLLFCRSPSSQPWTRTKLVGICETYGVGDSIVLESHYYSKNVILPRKGSKSNHRSQPNLVSFFVFSFRYRMSVLFLYSRPAAWLFRRLMQDHHHHHHHHHQRRRRRRRMKEVKDAPSLATFS